MIVIYATSNCGWCKRALKLCKDYSLKHEYIVMDMKDKDGTKRWKDNMREEFETKFPDAKTVPQITWHGRNIGGYEDLASEVQNTRNYGDGEL